MSATLLPLTVEPSVPFDGLLALIAAAQALEHHTQPPTTDLSGKSGQQTDSEREKRTMAVYVRRFEEMQQPPKRQKRQKRAADLVGRTLSKQFKDGRGRPKMYRGQVVSVSCATRERPFVFGAGVTATVKYLVHYEDGDAEDMTHADVLRHLVD